MRTSYMTPFAFETLTIDNTEAGIGCTLATYIQGGIAACWAEGALEVAQIRYRIDGTAPTATVGVPVEVGQFIIFRNLDEIRKFRGIRTGSVSGKISIHYWKSAGGQ